MAFRIGKLVAMITGGANGLGRATAEHFVKHGGKVAILDLPDSPGEEVVEKLGSENCTFCPCDVMNTDEVMDAVELTKGLYDGLHVLVNCAGKAFTRAVYNLSLDKPHELDLFQSALDTNVVGTFNTIRMAVPEMAKNDPDENGQRGIIINVSSTAAFDGERGQVAYGAANGAINSMTLPLSRELSCKGIRVLTIAPGYFQSMMTGHIPQKIEDLLSVLTPFPHRFGKGEEFAMMVDTIVKNPLLNGEVIRIDGAFRPIY